VAAWGESYTRTGRLELLHAHLRFATGIIAHLELSGLEGTRFSQTRVVGSRLTARVREDDGAGSLHILANRDDVTAVNGPFALDLEGGDMVVCSSRAGDALAAAAAAFVDSTRQRRPVKYHDPAAVGATLARIRAGAAFGAVAAGGDDDGRVADVYPLLPKRTHA
jgi:hypothetical protein